MSGPPSWVAAISGVTPDALCRDGATAVASAALFGAVKTTPPHGLSVSPSALTRNSCPTCLASVSLPASATAAAAGWNGGGPE